MFAITRNRFIAEPQIRCVNLISKSSSLHFNVSGTVTAPTTAASKSDSTTRGPRCPVRGTGFFGQVTQAQAQKENRNRCGSGAPMTKRKQQRNERERRPRVWKWQHLCAANLAAIPGTTLLRAAASRPPATRPRAKTTTAVRRFQPGAKSLQQIDCLMIFC